MHVVGSVLRIDLFSIIFVPPSKQFSSGDSLIGVKNLSPSPKGELGVDFILKGLFKSTIGEKGLIVIKDTVRFSDTSSSGRILIGLFMMPNFLNGGRLSD